MAASYCDVTKETEEFFSKKVSATEMDRYIDIHIMSDDNLKDVGKVIKCNELIKHLTGYEVIVLINDHIFFQLEEGQKHIVMEELLAQIHFDAEKDKLQIVKPDTNTFSLLLDKYGLKQYIRVQETIKTCR